MKSIPSLGHHNYSSDQNLLKRLAFAKYCRPQIDLLKQIVRLLGITKGQAEKKLIDVGCGNGQNLVQIRANGFSGELFGVDIAEGILKIAQKSNRAKKTGIHFSVGDALALEFPDNVFDYAILKHVLQNVRQPLQAIREVARILKPRGKMVIAVNGKKTRLILRNMRPQIARILNLKSFPDSDKHFNLEKVQPLVRKVFHNLQVVKFVSVVRLKDPKPYVDYIDSTRSFWGSVSDSDWQKALTFSKEYLGEILKKQTEIKDYVTIGLIIAIK